VVADPGDAGSMSKGSHSLALVFLIKFCMSDSTRERHALGVCRDVVLASSPSHTQSCMSLGQNKDGSLLPDHSKLPSSTPVFQMLAACVPGLWWLRDERHAFHLERQKKETPKLKRPKHERKFVSSFSDNSPLHCVGPLKIAVIGAGACSVPAHLVHGNDDVFVHAVDIDERAAPRCPEN
jgi:hypothetical protein